MSRYDSLAYRQRTGQMTADDYRAERNNVLKQLTVATKQAAVLAVELEQAFDALEEARTTITRQQESIDAAYAALEEFIDGESSQPVAVIEEAFDYLKGVNA